MGRRERRRLFKEACVQLLSAIKTQISEDELELKKKRARAHELQIAAHTSCCLPLTEDISRVFVYSNQRALDSLVFLTETSQEKKSLVIRLCGSRGRFGK